MDARSSAREEGTLAIAALGAAKEEADLPGVLDDLGILRVRNSRPVGRPWVGHRARTLQ